MITTQILIKNNEKTIKNTLESIKEIKSNIIIGNLGSTDRTIEICQGYDNVEIVEIKEKNYSNVRNKLKKEGMNFFINPWEILVQGHEIIKNIKNTTNVYVFQNNVISKEIRIWQNENFKNPIYETIINKKAEINDQIIISSKNKPDDTKEKLQIIEKWIKDRPVDIEPYYYLATSYLSLGDYEKFLFYASEYCNRENKFNNSLIMMKYYIAQIKLHKNKIKEAAELAVTCASYFPSMAEFWCLLGDIFYLQRKWDKAKCFYENAKIVGKKRKNKDELPIEIAKYKEYPEKMISNINLIKNNSINIA